MEFDRLEVDKLIDNARVQQTIPWKRVPVVTALGSQMLFALSALSIGGGADEVSAQSADERPARKASEPGRAQSIDPTRQLRELDKPFVAGTHVQKLWAREGMAEFVDAFKLKDPLSISHENVRCAQSRCHYLLRLEEAIIRDVGEVVVELQQHRIIDARIASSRNPYSPTDEDLVKHEIEYLSQVRREIGGFEHGDLERVRSYWFNLTNRLDELKREMNNLGPDPVAKVRELGEEFGSIVQKINAPRQARLSQLEREAEVAVRGSQTRRLWQERHRKIDQFYRIASSFDGEELKLFIPAERERSTTDRHSVNP